jgi:hypothetical protein
MTLWRCLLILSKILEMQENNWVKNYSQGNTEVKNNSFPHYETLLF